MGRLQAERVDSLVMSVQGKLQELTQLHGEVASQLAATKRAVAQKMNAEMNAEINRGILQVLAFASVFAGSAYLCFLQV